MWQAFQMQRKEDKRLIPYMVGVIVLSIAVFTALGFVLGSPWLLIPLGVVLGILGAFILFGRRVQKNVYTKAEGQPGAAGWALGNMRGQWRVKQAVAGTSQLDAVHRVIGKPGIILVAEGSPTRIKSLLGQEKKRVARIIGTTPIYEVVVDQLRIARTMQGTLTVLTMRLVFTRCSRARKRRPPAGTS